jgi:hypothetical protein
MPLLDSGFGRNVTGRNLRLKHCELTEADILALLGDDQNELDDEGMWDVE